MKRRILWIAAAAVAAVLLAGVAALVLIQTSWFHGKVRAWLANTVETATGGRAEIGSFEFDWHNFEARLKAFTLHGTEPAGKPPLFQAASVTVGLKLVSLLERTVDIRSLDVASPRIYLIVNPDGSTNLPQPKVKRAGAKNAIETVLQLAIGRFSVERGEFEIESRGKVPFEVGGRNFAAALAYDRAGPRYRGNISIQPLEAAGLSTDVDASVAFERNRIAISSAKLSTAASEMQFSGAIEDLAFPHGDFQFRARLANADAERLLDTKLLKTGVAEVAGQATWVGGAQYAVTGNLHAYGLEYRDRYLRLSDFRADGAVTAGPGEIRLSEARLAGAATISHSTFPLQAHVGRATLRGSDLALDSLALSAVGGEFRGNATLRRWDRYDVRGQAAGFDVRRTVAIYSAEPLPWNGVAGGDVHLEGSFERSRELRIEAALAVAPASEGAPVRGQLQANYDARSGILDLGRSAIALPHSHAEISGAIGRELRVHLETRDLGDLLPAVGEDPSSFPVRLENGHAVFDGKVTGSLNHPEITGRLNAAAFSYESKRFDSLEGDVTASPDNAALRNAAVKRGGLRAQFEIAVALENWKTDGRSAIFGHATARNISLAELAGFLDLQSLPVSGTAGVTAQISGAAGDPLVNADVTASRGSFQDEPFDSASGRVTYTNRMLQVSGGRIAAGTRQVRIDAAFDHTGGSYDTGRLRFDVATNQVPLGEIRALAAARPGITGTAEVTARGTVDVVTAPPGQLPVRVLDLHADVAAHSLQLTGQPLGDLHLTANSQGQVLRAHLESDFAGSGIRGDGQWQLEGDYPGSATVAFARTSMVQLRAWLFPAPDSFAANLAGSVEGLLRIDGPALKPQSMRAELRIPNLEIVPESQTGLPPSAFSLHNSGDLVATMANSVVTIQNAHLTGKNTDLQVTGKVALDQKNPFDLRVAGKADLAAAHDWDPNFTASGFVTTDAALRGTLQSPQISGRLEFRQASFNIVDVPNGISNANGTILFTGDRASIQTFTGETGGGKIRLNGFVAYGGGPLIYRLHAAAQQVRVRYPEGVSTVADASLSLTGTTDRSMLSGSITILRTGFNPQSDFSSLVAQSAEPVRTPSARTGFLGGLNYDIQISTAPDVQVESSLTQDVQVEANLRLRGTVTTPAMLGRVNITHGQVVFFGTRYNISQGSISFFNPLAIEPVLNVDLETKARGIEVTLNVSGPLNKLNLTPRSDPPLQFNEIVALLATGRTPTADTSLYNSQNAAASTFQQTGPSALLGQALASPVTGRLQRFFGVSRLRIDPTLPGVEYNPQARLTLEQQVTPDITFTYITDVTSTNPQVVSVEWAFAKQWSVMAQREENGMVGMDIFFKKRF